MAYNAFIVAQDLLAGLVVIFVGLARLIQWGARSSI
jgi:hypothetical protein